MRRVRRILLAVKDSQSPATASVAKAAQLALAFGAELEIFHALATSLYSSSYSLSEKRLTALEADLKTQCLSDLEKIAARLRRDDIKVSISAEWDFPAYEAIVRRAMHIKADLIVIEQHAGRHIAPRLLQLTDWELLRYSPIPVLLVKSSRRYSRPVVLAAVDPSHSFAKPSKLDTEILSVGNLFSQALKGTLHAVHAYGSVPLGVMMGDAMSAQLITDIVSQATTKALSGFESLTAKAQIPKSRRHLLSSVATDAIGQTAQKTGSAIVVMGSISRSGLKRLLIGNTAERVIDQLTCDVLLVKPPRFPNKVERRSRGPRLATVQIPPFAY
jgi:universal stress protein E